MRVSSAIVFVLWLAGAPSVLAIEAQKGWPLEGFFTGEIVVVDLDGDGALDIVVRVDDGVSVYHNDGSEMEGWPFILPLFIPGSVTQIDAVAVGDVDGDGELDVGVGEGRNSPCVSRIFVLDSSGEIKPGWPIEVPDSELTYDLALGDLDGDGDLEIITRNDADEHQVFAYHGDGSLVEGWPVTLDIDEDLDPRDFDFGIGELAVGDVDFDGRAEVLISAPMPGHSGPMFLFNGDGTNYHHWPAVAGGLGSDLCIIWPIIADLDGDFVCEIVGMSNGSVFAYSAERRPKRFLSGPSGLPSGP